MSEVPQPSRAPPTAPAQQVGEGQAHPRAHSEAGGSPPDRLEPSTPTPAALALRRDGGFGLFSGRQRSARPPALVSGRRPAWDRQASEMTGGWRKPFGPGRPRSVLTVLGVSGHKGKLGSVQIWQQAEDTGIWRGSRAEAAEDGSVCAGLSLSSHWNNDNHGIDNNDSRYLLPGM